jgi:hypothetical protein
MMQAATAALAQSVERFAEKIMLIDHRSNNDHRENSHGSQTTNP